MRFPFPSKSYFRNKRVMVRVDFNVDSAHGKIIDDFRIQQTLPTIRAIQSQAKYVLLISHRGSFEKPCDDTLTLRPVARHLARLLRRTVFFFDGPLGSFGLLNTRIPKHAVVLLENIRHYRGERENSKQLAQQLAQHADCFINDAFGESHRKEASLVAITKLLPSFAGPLVQNEIAHLEALKANPAQPFVVILGGVKLKTKLPLIKDFVKSAKYILVGGGVANTLLQAQGLRIGNSVCDTEFMEQAKKLLRCQKIVMPIDWVIADAKKQKVIKTIATYVPNGYAIYDIGPKTRKLYASYIHKARTIFWNGTMGYIEKRMFGRGTQAVQQAVLLNKMARTVVGGGDTTPFLRKGNPKSEIQNPKLFISTGGGAMLAYVAGKKLPGIEALKNNKTAKQK